MVSNSTDNRWTHTLPPPSVQWQQLRDSLKTRWTQDWVSQRMKLYLYIILSLLRVMSPNGWDHIYYIFVYIDHQGTCPLIDGFVHDPTPLTIRGRPLGDIIYIFLISFKRMPLLTRYQEPTLLWQQGLYQPSQNARITKMK